MGFLSVASYDWQGYGGGTVSRLHTGKWRSVGEGKYIQSNPLPAMGAVFLKDLMVSKTTRPHGKSGAGGTTVVINVNQNLSVFFN
jgi:hypothetical protein